MLLELHGYGWINDCGIFVFRQRVGRWQLTDLYLVPNGISKVFDGVWVIYSELYTEVPCIGVCMHSVCDSVDWDRARRYKKTSPVCEDWSQPKTPDLPVEQNMNHVFLIDIGHILYIDFMMDVMNLAVKGYIKLEFLFLIPILLGESHIIPAGTWLTLVKILYDSLELGKFILEEIYINRKLLYSDCPMYLTQTIWFFTAT